MTNVQLFVNGEGMKGGQVHHSIEGHPFLGKARTAPRYRFFSIRDEFPALWPVEEGGMNIDGELYEVPDPRAAFRKALSLAGEDDVVLYAGPGHEDYQEVAGQRLPYSARDDVKLALREAGRL